MIVIIYIVLASSSSSQYNWIYNYFVVFKYSYRWSQLFIKNFRFVNIYSHIYVDIDTCNHVFGYMDIYIFRHTYLFNCFLKRIITRFRSLHLIICIIVFIYLLIFLFQRISGFISLLFQLIYVFIFVLLLRYLILFMSFKIPNLYIYVPVPVLIFDWIFYIFLYPCGWFMAISCSALHWHWILLAYIFTSTCPHMCFIFMRIAVVILQLLCFWSAVFRLLYIFLFLFVFLAIFTNTCIIEYFSFCIHILVQSHIHILTTFTDVFSCLLSCL